MKQSKKSKRNIVKLILFTILAPIMMNLFSSIAYAEDEKEKTYSGADTVINAGDGVVSFTPASSEYNLSADDSWSTILASYLFSNANDKAHEIRYSYEGLAYYKTSIRDGNLSSNSGWDVTTGSYGAGYNVNQKDGSANPAGIVLTRYMASLYDYDWFVPLSSSAAKGFHGSATFALMWGGAKEKGGSFISKFLLASASASAYVFDGMVSAMRAFSGMFSTVDLPKLFGLDKNAANGTVADENSSNLVEWLIAYLQNTTGLTGRTLRYLRYVIYFFITASFLTMIVISMVNYQGNKRSIANRGKRFVTRVLVIIFLIPSSNVLIKIFDGLTSSFTDDFASPVMFSQNYVVDTLHWAIVSNLNADMINTDWYNEAYRSSSADIGKPLKSLKPTEERVRDLSSKVEIAYSNLQLSDNLDSKDEENLGKVTAAELVNGVAHKTEADVNQYLAAISSLGSKDVGKIAASIVINPGERIQAGDAFGNAYDDKMPENLYFLISNSKEVQKHAKDKAGDFDGDIKSGYELKENDGTDSHSYKEMTYGNGLKAYYNSSQTYFNAREFSWNRPDSYIYGTEPSGNNKNETTYITNYLNTAGTHQNNDPITGEKTEKGTDFRTSTYTNSLGIALQNKYAGISKVSGGSNPSLSTQSTVFFLQSAHISKKGMIYLGQNTAPNDEAGTSNKGIAGISFARFVIPNTGKWSLLGKMGSFSTVWICSAVCATLSLLYLLMTPLLGATFKSIKAFLSAGLTGNIISFFEYLIRMGSIKASFMFALMGTFLVTVLSTNIIAAMPVAQAIVSGTALTGGGVIGMIVLVFVLTIAISWPVLNIGVGSKGKKVSILGAIIFAPYLLAESAIDWLETLQHAIYGRSSRSGFFGQLKNRTSLMTKEEHLHRGKNLAEVGGKLGTAAATGGASLALSAGGSAATAATKAAALVNKGKEMVDGVMGGNVNGAHLDDNELDDILEKDGVMRDEDGNIIGTATGSYSDFDTPQNPDENYAESVLKEMEDDEDVLATMEDEFDKSKADQFEGNDELARIIGDHAEILDKENEENQDVNVDATIEDPTIEDATIEDPTIENANVKSVDGLEQTKDDKDIDGSLEALKEMQNETENETENDFDKLSVHSVDADHITAETVDGTLASNEIQHGESEAIKQAMQESIKQSNNKIKKNVTAKTSKEIDAINKLAKDGKIDNDTRIREIKARVENDDRYKQLLKEGKIESIDDLVNVEEMKNTYLQAMKAKPKSTITHQLDKQRQDAKFNQSLNRAKEYAKSPIAGQKQAKLEQVIAVAEARKQKANEYSQKALEKNAQVKQVEKHIEKARAEGKKENPEMQKLLNQLKEQRTSYANQAATNNAQASAMIAQINKSFDKVVQRQNGVPGAAMDAARLIKDNVYGTDSTRKSLDKKKEMKVASTGDKEQLEKFRSQQSAFRNQKQNAMDQASINDRKMQQQMLDAIKELGREQRNTRN